VLVVLAEDNRGIILDTPVYHEVTYQRQQDTLIVWTDPKTTTDIALSFQEAGGCEDVWMRICRYQGRPLDDDNEFLMTRMHEEGLLVDSRVQDATPVELPAPELKNLNDIFEMVNTTALRDRDGLVAGLLKDNYVPKLLQCFLDCEDLEDEAGLAAIHKTIKTLVFLNDTALYEILFNEDNLLNVIGTFEYDPVMRMHQVKHREFLLNKARFKKVVQINDATIEAKIHQNFRLQYLKDVVLPRLLDDQTFTTINSIIFFNNVTIVSQLTSNAEFINELFEKLKDPSTQVDAFAFLQELCSLARSLQQGPRAAFFHALVEHGLLSLLETAITDKRLKLRLGCMDILTHMVTHDTCYTRKVLAAQQNFTLLKLLVRHLVSDTDTGVQEQLKEVIRCLIDPETMDTAPEKDEFLNAFYDQCIDTLTAPLVASDATFDEYSSIVKDHACELLAFCLVHHGFRIKYYVLRHNIAQKMLRLVTQQKDRFLVVSAIRVFRAFVGLKDDFYDRYIIKQNLFAPIINVFFENGDRYNLLNSVVLELLNFIRLENRVDLIRYIVQIGGERLKDVDYVDTVQLLLQRYAQNEDAAINGVAIQRFIGVSICAITLIHAAVVQQRNLATKDEKQTAIVTANISKRVTMKKKNNQCQTWWIMNQMRTKGHHQ